MLFVIRPGIVAGVVVFSSLVAANACRASSIQWDYASFTGSVHADTYAEVFDDGELVPEICNHSDDAAIPTSAGLTATALSSCTVELGSSDSQATAGTGASGTGDFLFDVLSGTLVSSRGAGGANASVRFGGPFTTVSELDLDLSFHFRAEGTQGESVIAVSLMEGTTVLDQFNLTTYAGTEYDQTETLSAHLFTGHSYHLAVSIDVTAWDGNVNSVTLDAFTELKVTATQPATWGAIKNIMR